jgi:hypothetical protein
MNREVGPQIHDMRCAGRNVIVRAGVSDAHEINAIFNNPSVRRYIAQDEKYIDKTEQLNDARNVFVVGRYGVCVFLYRAFGIYEVHTAVTVEGRGSWTSELTSAAVDYMFVNTPCYEVVTMIPKGHLAAKTAALARGLRYEMTRPNLVMYKGRKTDINVFSYRVQDWAATADHFESVGQAFHDEMHEAASRLGAHELEHAVDKNHNKYVGIALSMVRGGQIKKGVAFYNRWAVLARYNILELLRETPHPVVSIDERFAAVIKPAGIDVVER